MAEHRQSNNSKTGRVGKGVDSLPPFHYRQFTHPWVGAGMPALENESLTNSSHTSYDRFLLMKNITVCVIQLKCIPGYLYSLLLCSWIFVFLIVLIVFMTRWNFCKVPLNTSNFFVISSMLSNFNFHFNFILIILIISLCQKVLFIILTFFYSTNLPPRYNAIWVSFFYITFFSLLCLIFALGHIFSFILCVFLKTALMT